MTQSPFTPGANVVPIVVLNKDSGRPADIGATEAGSMIGSQDDPRVQEALRLAKAFLAIDDPAARLALVTLAEQLVSQDWARKVFRG